MKKTLLLILFTIFCFTSFSCEKIDDEFFADGDTLRMVKYLTFSNWEKRQGGAIYNNMLVCLNATDKGKGGKPNGFIYDVRTGAMLCDMIFTANLEKKKYTMPHANQVSFGTGFYDEDSDFPLLYVSQVNGGWKSRPFWGAWCTCI